MIRSHRCGNEPGDPSLPANFDAPTARKFVLKRQSASTSPILTASTLANAADQITSPPLELKNADSIPGWGDVINPDGDCTFALADEKAHH